MKETSSKLAAEKVKSDKESKIAAATTETTGQPDKPKEKKSSKIGSIKMNPDSIAESLEKLKIKD